MMRGTCNRCHKTIPPTHGFCSPCANYADGYDAGANFCDDFEGTTEAAAIAFYKEFGAEALISYMESGEEVDAAMYGEGMLAGLKRSAVKNAEVAAELAAEGA